MSFNLMTGYPRDVPTPAQAKSEALLRGHGIRPTRQRLAVLGALAAEQDDATAQKIHGALRAAGEPVGLATVYRTLAALSERGVIDALMHHPGEVCYRLCSSGHHHHLVCEQCHRVVELADCDLDSWLAARASRHGFTISTHTVEASGVCAGCRPTA
jgi:Fur family ferric uptake transcriptional regulator